ncbi:MAG TPA: molybdenum ABC transporter ATP-binding protein [Pseudolabrys sp.]
MTAQNVIDVSFRGMLGRFALDAAFTVPATGVSALFGPSGCGKTTVLRCMAGLQRLAEGFCTINGDIWQDKTNFRPTHMRPVGYVFQEASLFPHLSVRRNLLYGAPRQPMASATAEIRFDEVIDLLGLAGLLDRAPHNLSGGERQRVAVGRALLSQPRLLLMDEPLSALDRQTKDEILPFLERLHASLSLPVMYVSHDISEIERLADHLVLMRSGRVIASGPFSDVRTDPSLPLALAKEAAVSLDAVVKAYDENYGLATLDVSGGRFTVPMPKAPIGSRRRLTIAASDVSLARERPNATTILNILPAKIISATPAGEHETVVLLRLGPEGTGDRLLARVTRRSWDELGLAEGMMVFSQVKGAALAPG